MTTTEHTLNATTAPADDAVEIFLDRFLTDLAGASSAVMTVIGDRLGLYVAMTGAGAVTADELAAKTGLQLRLVTEWLASQTVSEYVSYDPDARTYALPDAHAAVLSHVDSPAYVIGAPEITAGQFFMLDKLRTAFETDGAIDYDDFPDFMFDGIRRYFRTAHNQELAGTWFPAVPGLVEVLERGGRVADVGCGHGFATLLIGKTWPSSEVTGFDVHEPSIAAARASAIEDGSPRNVTFRVADSTAIGPGPYDVVVYFDALHDMGDPPAALRRAHEVLADGGIVVVVEPWSIDRLEEGLGNPALRIDYSCSTSVCTPGSLAQPGRYGLGTLGGPTKRIELLTGAGFGDAALVADTGSNLVLAARK